MLVFFALFLFEEQANLCFFLSQARAGIISTVEVLKVMEAFVNEPNYTVWSDLSCNLGILSTLLSHTDFYEEIQEFVKDVFSPIGERLGWDPKPGEGNGYTEWERIDQKSVLFCSSVVNSVNSIIFVSARCYCVFSQPEIKTAVF